MDPLLQPFSIVHLNYVPFLCKTYMHEKRNKNFKGSKSIFQRYWLSFLANNGEAIRYVPKNSKKPSFE